MPEYQNEYSDLGGVANLGHTMNNIALGLAQQKAMQMRFQQQMALKMAEQAMQQRLYQQHGQAFEAQAARDRAALALDQAKTKDLGIVEDVKSKLGNAAGLTPLIQAGMDMGIDMGPQMRINQGNIMQGIAQLKGSETANLPEKMSQMLQMGDPRMQQLMATGTKAAIPVSSQGGIVNAATGALETMMPQQLSPQENLVNPYTGAELGVNPRVRTSVQDPRLAELKSQGNIARAVMPGGDLPSRSSPAYQVATNALSRIMQLNQGIETPHGAPVDFTGPPNPANSTLPLPANKADLKAGQKYKTARGEATWDGTKFVQ